MSHFDSQTTVLKCPQTTVALGEEGTFSCGTVQAEKHMEGSFWEALRTPTATGLPGPQLGGFGRLPIPLDMSSQPLQTRSSNPDSWEGRCYFTSCPSAVFSPGPLPSPMLTVAIPFLSRSWTHSLAPVTVTKNPCLAPFPLNCSTSAPLPDVFHHFTHPFLKLFLLNFYDSSPFYSA